MTDAFPVAGRTGETKALRSCPVGYRVQTRVQKTYVPIYLVKTHNYTLFENGINLTWLVYCCPVYQALKSKLVHTQNWENKNSCCHFSENFLLPILQLLRGTVVIVMAFSLKRHGFDLRGAHRIVNSYI